MPPEPIPPTPITHIPGVDPAEVWEAVAQVEAGRVVGHAELMARLHARDPQLTSRPRTA